MQVFRIEREKYLGQTLSGKGASLSTACRWNSQNSLMVYTAESRALSLLEISVHLDLKNELPQDRYIVKIEIPDNVNFQVLNIEQLPKNWNAKPPSLITQYIGDDFIKKGDAGVLRVPSAIIPQEYNFLINPLHPEANRINVISKTPLHFDERLIK